MSSGGRIAFANVEWQTCATFAMLGALANPRCVCSLEWRTCITFALLGAPRATHRATRRIPDVRGPPGPLAMAPGPSSQAPVSILSRRTPPAATRAVRAQLPGHRATPSALPSADAAGKASARAPGGAVEAGQGQGPGAQGGGARTRPPARCQQPGRRTSSGQRLRRLRPPLAAALGQGCRRFQTACWAIQALSSLRWAQLQTGTP
eukprot:4040284-Alexandrium_andersonii.AAC.1